MPMGNALGIDLGTTHSLVAYLDRDGRPVSIPNADGDLKTPCVVFFDRETVIVGREALKAAEQSPERVVRFVSRQMGQRLAATTRDGRQFPPAVLQSLILRKLQQDAEDKFGPDSTVVISVPVSFDESRRKATLDAARLAGFAHVDLVNATSAAALAYVSHTDAGVKETILAVDFGSGSCDATLFDLDNRKLRAVASAGDRLLGGIDWDRHIAEFFAAEFQSAHGIDPLDDPSTAQRILREAEEAKRTLSVRDTVTVEVAHEGKTAKITLTRSKFQQLTWTLLGRAQQVLHRLIQGAKRNWRDVNRLIVVGEASRLPAFRTLLEHETGLTIDGTISPEEAVAQGTAIYAGMRAKHPAAAIQTLSLVDVSSNDLGVVGLDGATGLKRLHVMIPRNTPLPAVHKSKFSTSEDGQSTIVVNVMEGDAAGDAITPAGRCLVQNLPAGLPKDTPVVLEFRYAANGRVTFAAHLPTVDQQPAVRFESAAGLSEAELTEWQRRIAGGELLGRVATPQAAVAKEIPAVSAQTRNSDQPAKKNNTVGRRRHDAPQSPAGKKTVSATAASAVAVLSSSPPHEETLKTTAAITNSAAPAPPPLPPSRKPPQDVRANPAEPAPSAAVATVLSATSSASPVQNGATSAPQPPEITSTPPAVTTIAAVATIAANPSPPKPPATTTLPAEIDPDDIPVRNAETKRAIAAFTTSLLINLAVLLVFGFVMLPDKFRDPLLGIISSMPEPVKPEVEFEEVKVEKPEVIDRKETPAEIVKKVLADTNDKFEVDVNDLAPSATLTVDPNASAPAAAAPYSGKFGGRSKAGRSALVAKYGGTKESEMAVREGLEWLVRHQNGDGSWSFDHRSSACNCGQHGRFGRSNMGATAMALLCFLGAGETYSEGDFQHNVEKGLMYLIKNGKVTRDGGDFRGNFEGNGGMYIQGLVTIVLCEALAMNEADRVKDVRDAKGKSRTKSKPKISPQRRFQVSRQLAYAAESALKFVTTAQGTDGGWRYTPRVSSDTSVVGWQVMALASAHTAKLPIVPQTVAGARAYLDTVQSKNGSQYSYTRRSPAKPSMTAVGLLSRMYLGWTREHPGIRYGVEYLSKVGPSRNDMYYNYYATQVMHQYGGTMWEQWNKVMRDQLVNSQIMKGHAKGSWDVTDPHGSAGGRLYQTCLSVMTLEVYYRHMPLYEHRDLNTGAKGDNLAKTKKKSDGKGKKPAAPGKKSPQGKKPASKKPAPKKTGTVTKTKKKPAKP